jgi:hypothetical protein
MRRRIALASVLSLAAFVGPVLAQGDGRIPTVAVLAPAPGPDAPMMRVLREELH